MHLENSKRHTARLSCALLAWLAACDDTRPAAVSSNDSAPAAARGAADAHLDTTKPETACAGDCRPSQAGSLGARDASMRPDGARDASAPSASSAGAHSGPLAASTDDAGTVATKGSPSTPRDVESTGRPTGVADCFSATSGNDPAVLEFRRAFSSAEYAARDKAIEGLKAAAAAKPMEEEIALLHGLANLWRAAERQTLQDALAALESTQTAARELERAYALCPSDHRILAWLGPTNSLLGQLTLDSALEAEGEKQLERGNEKYRTFVSFANIIRYADRPTDDPGFKKALETVYWYLGDGNRECAETGDPACRNTGIALHNFQGTALYMGDVLAKAQDKVAALAAYEVAKTAPDWASWDFQGLLEDRIRTLDARTAAAKTDQSADDLEAAWNASNQCMLCHRD